MFECMSTAFMWTDKRSFPRVDSQVPSQIAVLIDFLAAIVIRAEMRGGSLVVRAGAQLAMARLKR